MRLVKIEESLKSLTLLKIINKEAEHNYIYFYLIVIRTHVHGVKNNKRLTNTSSKCNNSTNFVLITSIQIEDKLSI